MRPSPRSLLVPEPSRLRSPLQPTTPTRLLEATTLVAERTMASTLSQLGARIPDGRGAAPRGSKDAPNIGASVLLYQVELLHTQFKWLELELEKSRQEGQQLNERVDGLELQQTEQERRIREVLR